MNDFDPSELSALLDGELDPARAAQVRALIAADPEVRAAFERLTLADQQLQSIAAAASFRPQVRWPAPARQPGRRWLMLPLLAVGLAWATGKLAPAMAASFAVNALALAVFVAWLAPLALREARGEAPFAI